MVPMEAKMEPIALLKLKNKRLQLIVEIMELRHPQGSQHRNTEVLDHLYAHILSRDTEIQRLGNPWWRLVQQLVPVRERPWFKWSVGIARWIIESLTFRGILPERIGRCRLLDCLIDLSE
jgi:hypothetical protein